MGATLQTLHKIVYHSNRSLFEISQIFAVFGAFSLNQGGPTSALLWATFQNYSSLRASAG